MHPSALALNGQCAAFDMHVRTLTSRGRRSSRALVLGARGRVFCILDGQLRKNAGEDEVIAGIMRREGWRLCVRVCASVGVPVRERAGDASLEASAAD